MSRKKKGFFVTIIAVVLSALVCLPFASRLFRSESSTDQETADWLTVVNCDVEWEENSMTLDLLSGKIVTSDEVDGIFVNVNGVGRQNLSYTVSGTQTINKTYITNTLTAQDGILLSGFDRDQTVNVDIYVEYGDKVYRVDSQQVKVKSCWIGGRI